MPAAAVIPAPIAYIKVVAVKKLVVGFRKDPVVPGRMSCVSTEGHSFGRRPVLCIHLHFTLKEFDPVTVRKSE